MKYNHLPHIDIEGYYQFITFRTYESVDDYLLALYCSRMDERKKQLAIDTYLDTSLKGAYLEGEILDYLFHFIRSKHNDLYKLIAFAIMPNHVHLLIKPFESLDSVMKKLKGASAKEINRLLNSSGRFWARDYFDRGIRNEKHFQIVYEYIKNNPKKIMKRDFSPETCKNETETEKRFYGVFE